MNIGIDYGGTITEAPEFFRIFADAMLNAGHMIHVITASPSRGVVESSLRRLHFPYTDIWTQENSLSSIPEWKAEIVVKLGITVFIDDDPVNMSMMPDGMTMLRICH
jgi:hypothetical protein